jgi:hypothetical protein
MAASDATGNPFFTRIVGGTVHVLDPAALFAGGVNRRVVMVEVKMPNIGLPDPASRAAFISAATDVVDALTVANHDRGDTWVNILNAPDGVGGVAYTGEALIAAAERSVRLADA